MKKTVLLTSALCLLSTALSLGVVGSLRLQMAYASPHTDIDVATAYNMITNGSYPNLVVLDVRRQDEYDSGHIYGAVWIPHTELEARIGELAGHENHEIIVYCRSGVRSDIASGILDSHTFTKVYDMLGGILAWQSAGYPVWIATVHNLNTTFSYDTIQAAIDAPQTSDGHTIFVEEGTYYENVVVSKSLSLVGENRSTTIVDANEDGHVVEVTADNVTITGFTIRKSGCGCASKSGVYVGNYHRNVNVTNNLIIQNGYGVKLDNAYNITIASNLIADNAYEGVYISWSFGNTISGNNITNNNGTGGGITLSLSSDNTISGNIVSNNIIGIYLLASSNNVIFHNNFINNTKQIFSYNSVNIWDDGYPSGGNYWSDYEERYPNATEIDDSGIWDTPYVIDENNQDNYPIVPEFPTWTSTLLVLLALTVAIAIQKRRLSKKYR